MSSSVNDSREALRRSIYLLLIVIGMGLVLGRILAVDSVDTGKASSDANLKKLDQKKKELEQQFGSDAAMNESLREKIRAVEREETQSKIRLGVRRPFLGGNDRSRWCTVRALVEPEMRVEGAPYAIDKVVQQRGWDTIDMVKRTDNGHLYSSKPPLFSTLMAGEYWVIYRLTGMSLGEHPFEIGRFMLITINGGCLLIYFLVLARLIERLGHTDWGRIFVMAAAVCGTFVTTFAVVINNHLVGAACAAMLLDALVRIWLDDDRRIGTFILVGLFSGLLAADELPAGAFSAAAGLIALWRAPRQTLAAALPALLVVVAAFFVTNWIALESLKPAYLHRSQTDKSDNWYDYQYLKPGAKTPTPSYWTHPTGIDRGEPSTRRYALHVLVGHHGIFSLTPFWLLSLCGGLIWLRRPPEPRLRWLALALGGVTVVCMAFYLSHMVDHNYGGTATGFRWVFWMAPLWLALMLPSADGIAGYRWARGVALLLLAFSVISASYATWNPWTPPWIMDFMGYMGWL